VAIAYGTICKFVHLLLPHDSVIKDSARMEYEKFCNYQIHEAVIQVAQ